VRRQSRCHGRPFVMGVLVLLLAAGQKIAAQQTDLVEVRTESVAHNPANGHYYEYVEARLSWHAAKTASERRAFRGVRGHLATITSAQEQRFVTSLIGSASVKGWAGGFQVSGSREPSGGWRWVTGEPFEYVGWRSSEPNDGGHGEDVLEVYSRDSWARGGWNDRAGASEGAGFIVEYDLASAAGERDAVVPVREQPETPAHHARGSFAGAWDSTLYAWSDPIHPRTVAVRIEVIDARTRQPVAGATVRLNGTYYEERIGVLAEEALGLEQRDPGTPAKQRRDFELAARTGRDGVAVFALSWQKKFPWSLERPLVRNPNSVGEGLSHARSWMRPIDDIEKVQRLEIRHPDYRGLDVGVDFEHLLEFGQDQDSESQDPEIFERFHSGWRNEVGKRGVRFFALDLGPGFPDFGNGRSKRPEFFDRIRREDFGIVYEVPEQNLTSLTNRGFAGPYFAYLIELALDPARQEIRVVPSRDQSVRHDDDEDDDGAAARRAERLRREREAAERAKREAEEARRLRGLLAHHPLQRQALPAAAVAGPVRSGSGGRVQTASGNVTA